MALAGVVGIVAAQGFSDTQPLASKDPIWFTLSRQRDRHGGYDGLGHVHRLTSREPSGTLRERADRAEAEQQLRVDNARSHERARIAREMHDVLAHRISQVSMHAGALAYRDDLSPRRDPHQCRGHPGEGERGAQRPARGPGRAAGPRVMALVGPPYPPTDDLPALIEESREGGMHIEFTDLLEGEAGDAGRRGPNGLPDRPGGADQRSQTRAWCDGADPAQRIPGGRGRPAAPQLRGVRLGTSRTRLRPRPDRTVRTRGAPRRAPGAPQGRVRRSSSTAGYRGPHEHLEHQDPGSCSSTTIRWCDPP